MHLGSKFVVLLHFPNLNGKGFLKTENTIRRFLKILAWFFGVLFALLITAYFLLQLPAVQTYIAQKAAGWFSNKIGATVEIKGVNIQFFDTIILEGVYVEDKKQDTLLYAGRLYVGITDFSTSDSWVNLSKITLSDARIGLRKYPDEKGLNFQFIVDAFKSDKPKEKKQSKPFDLKCKTVSLVNSKFSYTIVGAKPPEWGFDAKNIIASSLNAKFDDLHMHGDTIDATMKKLAAVEKSGLMLLDMQSKFRFSGKEMLFDEMTMKANNTAVNGSIQFTYNNFRAFAYALDSVNVNFNINNADVQMADLAYFSPTLRGINLKAKVKGAFTGTFNRLKGKNLELFYNKTYLKTDIKINNVTNSKEMFIDARIKQLVTNANDIATIPMPPFNTRNRLDLPPEVYRLGQISFNGNFQGFLTSFVADGTFKTALGTVVSDLQLAQGEDKIMAYDGNVATQNFNLGALLPDQGLGILSVNVSVDGRGFDLKTINTEVKGHVTALDFNEYRYSNIDIDGKLVKTEFTGRVQSNDPNMQLAFNGTMSISKDVPVYNFNAEIVRIDLTALNFVKKDSALVVSAKLSSDFTGNTLESLNGRIQASGVELTYGTTVYPVGDVTLYSDVNTPPKQMRLISDIADVNIIGEYKLETLGKTVMRTINAFMPSYLVTGRDTNAAENTQNFSFDAQIKNTDALFAIFYPDLKIAPGANFIGTYKSATDELTLTGQLPQVTFQQIPMNGISISSRTQNGTLYFATTIEKVEPADSLFLNNITISSFTKNDSLVADIDFENQIDSISNNGSITAVAHFYDENKITVHFPKLRLDAFTYQWNADPDNEIDFEGGRINIKRLVMSTPNESFRLFGAISPNPDDQLNLILTKFNLANINQFIPTKEIKVSGNINGSIAVSNLFDEPLFRSTLRVVDLKVNDTDFGTGNVVSNWDKNNKYINVDVALFRNGNSGKIKSLEIKGIVNPTSKTQMLDLTASVYGIALKSLNPYVQGIVKFDRGELDAEATIKGMQNAPKIDGKIKLYRPTVRVDYLGATYGLNSETIEMRDNRIVIDNMELRDNENANNTALVNGAITHKGFTDWAFDINIKANNFLALDKKESPDEAFYGKAYMSGYIRIKGDLAKTTITADVKTNRGTKFYIPLDNPNTASASDFIIFIDPNPEKTAKKVVVKKPKSSMGIVLNLDLEVTPDAEVQIIFDKQIGDYIVGSGSGNLKMNIDTKGEFKMYGEYVIDKGKYHFTLKNLIRKDFVVEKGGTINWTGDIYKARADLTAVYTVQTAFFPIMNGFANTDEIDQFKKKLPVQCRMTLREDLMSPKFAFSLTTTTTDDRARAALASIQSNPEELNKQMFSLLILNQFLPPSQTGTAGGPTTNYGAGAANSGFELLSNQLSNYLSKISDDFDINVDFVPSATGGQPQVIVGTSFRLLGDRLSFDVKAGNAGTDVGNSGTQPSGQGATGGNTATQAANTIVSDFSMDVKISNDGRLRGKVFNRSNQNNILTNDIPYTQGAGLSYRREFNKIGDLFRRKKPVKPLPPTPPDTNKTKDPVIPSDPVQNPEAPVIIETPQK